MRNKTNNKFKFYPYTPKRMFWRVFLPLHFSKWNSPSLSQSPTIIQVATDKFPFRRLRIKWP